MTTNKIENVISKLNSPSSVKEIISNELSNRADVAKENIKKDLKEAKKTNKKAFVAPIKNVNLKTGKNNVVGNVIDNWKDNGYAEIWERLDNKKNIMTISSGKRSHHKPGDIVDFQHGTKSNKFLFSGKFIEFELIKNISKFVLKYGNSLPGYVYK